LTLNFNDGTSQSLPVPKNAVAGVQFFGFTDLGTSIASIVLTEAGPFNSRDIFGIDDVRFGLAQATTITPEPSTLAMGVAGLLSGLVYVWRQSRKTKVA
jgi:hypothetical protein